MKKQLLLPFNASFLAVASSYAQVAPMFDPAIDDRVKEWCYAAESTTVIGLPFVPEPVQVTYDGAIYTRYAKKVNIHNGLVIVILVEWPVRVETYVRQLG